MEPTTPPSSAFPLQAIRPLGALPLRRGVLFRVWAPKARTVDLVLEPDGRSFAMRDAGDHYFELEVPEAAPGTRYRYRLDDGDAFPDPASRYQPEGVHGPAEVVDPGAYAWQDDAWEGVPQRALVFYELHVGTFSPAGTFDGVRERLPYLRDLGVTAVELMPVADFPGAWNWGYDPGALYAPARAYGSPDDLRALVDAAHAHGMAIFLDVVYNHLGPDGAYVGAYGPMFTDRHQTPWGQAINLDDTHSGGVRNLFLDNALHWLREYHFDGLRLDATHALQDDSPTHLLAELSAAVEALEGPRRLLIAEDHRNLNRVVLPRADGGYGLDGVWVDDFHHLVRHLAAGDRAGYYADYADATMHDVARALQRGWYYEGQPSPRTGKPRGTDAGDVRKDQCVICIQNHDQVGNRPQGNRLTDDVEPAVYRAASALLLFAPELPLLFMGQEWAASSPFIFFTDHEEELGRAVTKGRKEEFRDFPGFKGDVPDPQAASSYERSRLRWEEVDRMPHRGVLTLYRTLLALRRDLPDAFEARAPSDYTLVARRGPYELLVTFRGDAVLPLSDDAEVVLHTEQEEVASDPRPPRIEEGQVRFARAGALVARRPGGEAGPTGEGPSPGREP